MIDFSDIYTVTHGPINDNFLITTNALELIKESKNDKILLHPLVIGEAVRYMYNCYKNIGFYSDLFNHKKENYLITTIFREIEHYINIFEKYLEKKCTLLDLDNAYKKLDSFGPILTLYKVIQNYGKKKDLLVQRPLKIFYYLIEGNYFISSDEIGINLLEINENNKFKNTKERILEQFDNLRPLKKKKYNKYNNIVDAEVIAYSYGITNSYPNKYFSTVLTNAQTSLICLKNNVLNSYLKQIYNIDVLPIRNKRDFAILSYLRNEGKLNNLTVAHSHLIYLNSNIFPPIKLINRNRDQFFNALKEHLEAFKNNDVIPYSNIAKSWANWGEMINKMKYHNKYILPIIKKTMGDDLYLSYPKNKLYSNLLKKVISYEVKNEKELEDSLIIKYESILKPAYEASKEIKTYFKIDLESLREHTLSELKKLEKKISNFIIKELMFKEDLDVLEKIRDGLVD